MAKFKLNRGIYYRLPNSPKCRIHYLRDGVTYEAICPTPKSQADLQMFMLERKASLSMIKTIDAIN